MIEFWRNWRKTAAEKQQEAMNAYLDDALSAIERQQFEQEMARDESLRREVENLRRLRTQLRQLPSRPVPRNFMLDPARYGRPASQPLFRFYPALRAATVLTGIFLVVALAGGLFVSGGARLGMTEETAVVAVTRVATEIVQDEAEPLAGAPAAESLDSEAEVRSADDFETADEAATQADTEADGQEEPMMEEPVEEELAEEAPAEADVEMEMAEDAEVTEAEATVPVMREEAEPPAEAGAADDAAADAPDVALEPLPSPTAAPTESPPTATPAPTTLAEAVEAPAVPSPAPPETAVPDAIAVSPVDWVSIGFTVLLVIFVLLLVATLWVRRQL